ncbi:MAG: hypothetical protein OEY03_18060, partial [Rhizobacter sp.]|nr:hypothetical protein [Rhizobacter sp.]
SSAGGIVGPMARELQTAREQGRFMWLALSPEGTRRVTKAWRSGFYHVARAAGVPVGLAFLDYGKREVGVEHFMLLSGDIDADMAQIAHHLGARKGRHPDLAAPIRLKP